MGQVNAAESSDSYTVVIFRGSTAKPLRFSFPRRFVRKILIVAAILLVADLLVISHYVIRTGEVWELSAFRAEALSARQQTVAFSSAVDDLKKRLISMKEVNQRLRVMLGIETLKAGDQFNGRGGEETPLPEGSLIPADKNGEVGIPGAVERIRADGQGEQAIASGLKEIDEQELIASVKEGIAWLAKEADRQEQSLQELSLAAEQKSSRWAATPSIWPVKGHITAGFGERMDPFTGEDAFHSGLDIAAPVGSPVRAAADGILFHAGPYRGYGIEAWIDHGFGIATRYGHLSKVLVHVGEVVKRGQIIGMVGMTGRATGPHLHYEVLVHDTPVNPARYVGGDRTLWASLPTHRLGSLGGR